MSEQAKQEPKGPEVEVKAAPKRRTTSKHQAAKPKPKPEVDLTDLKRVSDEVRRLESLKSDRLALIQKAVKAGATTQQISEATGLSVPRLRQLIQK